MAAIVYILKGSKGRHYIGATSNLQQRLDRHNSGMVHSTKRLGLPLVIVSSKEFSNMDEALRIERMLKKWKNPSKSIDYLNQG